MQKHGGADEESSMRGPAPARPSTALFALAAAWAPMGVLFGVALAQTAGGYTGGANGPYIIVLAGDLGVPSATLWWIASGFGFALLPVAALGARLLRFGAERLLRVAALLGAAGMAILATTPAVPLAVVGATATGMSGALSLLASTTLLRGSAGHVSLVMAYASVSGLIAPLAIGGLEVVGVSGGWAMLLPVPLLVVVAARGVVNTSPDAEPPPGAALAPGAVLAPVRVDPRAVAAAWLVLVMAVVAEFSFLIWGVARLVDSGLATGPASILGVAFPAGMVIGRFVGARAVDTGPAGARARLLVSAAVTAAATVGVVTGPLPLILAGLFLAGLALSTSYPNALSLLVRVPGLGLRAATSLGAAGSGVAIVVAPSGLAALSQVVDLRLAFLLPLPVVAVLAGAALADGALRRAAPAR